MQWGALWHQQKGAAGPPHWGHGTGSQPLAHTPAQHQVPQTSPCTHVFCPRGLTPAQEESRTRSTWEDGDPCP